MHPILFQFSFITISSYIVFWGTGLIVFLLWTQSRAENKFKLPSKYVSSVVAWIYIAAILGGFLGNIVERLFFVEVPFGAFEGGMSSAPAILCAGVIGLYRLYRLKLPIDLFAEAATLPFAFLIGCGRIGCFLQGCCPGKLMENSVQIFGITVSRYPTEVGESTLGWIMLLVMYIIEKRAGDEALAQGKRGFIFPLFLSVYALYRIFFDPYRLREGIAPYYAVAAIIFSFIWVVYSVHIGRYKESKCVEK